MDISAVFFDFGNVLGFFSHRRAAEQLAAYCKVPAEVIQAFLFGGQLEDDYDSGRIATTDYLRLLRREFDLSASDEQLALACSDMFTPNDEVCALVPRLTPRRYKLMLLSNTNELHYRHFRRQFADTLAHFDALVTSHEVGVRKPRPDIYHACVRLAGCPAERCLLIDDMPANVEAARACGWQGVVYQPGVDLRRLLPNAEAA
jgi:putative hydrolase of the HAD superfamily